MCWRKHCDLLKFELGIALNENKARLKSEIVFCDCVAHQYSLNEMRRGRLLRAIAKCSPKRLSRTNARELTISFLYENQRPAEETTADRKSDEFCQGCAWHLAACQRQMNTRAAYCLWVSKCWLVFAWGTNRSQIHLNFTSPSLKCTSNTTFWICWNVESSVVSALDGLTRGGLWGSVNFEGAVWCLFLSSCTLNILCVWLINTCYSFFFSFFFSFYLHRVTEQWSRMLKASVWRAAIHRLFRQITLPRPSLRIKPRIFKPETM